MITSILTSGRARTIRFSTLTRLCRALDCQPGDLLSDDSAGGQPELQANRAARVVSEPARRGESGKRSRSPV